MGTTMNLTNNPFTARYQNGAVLIAGLILLLIITLIGISSMQSVALDEKMTANMRDATLAFQATESALSDGEEWLKNQLTPPDGVSSCDTNPCHVWDLNRLGNVSINAQSWWTSVGRPFSGTLNGVQTQPHYVIEYYGFVPYELSPDARSKGLGYYYYKVTAHGTGALDTSKVQLESIYTTQFN